MRSILGHCLNIMPVSSDDYSVITDLSIINILLETNYYTLWNNTFKNVSGVKLTNISDKSYINITKTVSTLMYPPAMSGGLYSGRITTELPESKKTSSVTDGTGGVPGGGTGAHGAYTNEVQSTNRINISVSSEIQKFVIDDIQVTNSIHDKKFGFRISDEEYDQFNVEVTFKDNITIKDVKINNIKQDVFKDQPISNGINLTSYYKSASINKPNSLVFEEWDDDILYIRLLICDITSPF
jgi:hypothetical protein